MTDADFAIARDRYELGTHTLVELADEFGITRQALSNRFKRNGVVKGSRSHELAEASSKGTKKAAEEAAAAAERFSDIRAEWIEDTRIQGVKSLKQVRLIAQKTLVDELRRPGGNVGAIEDQMKVLARYNKTLLDNLEGTLRILKSDEHVDEDDLPILSIEDLTDEEILEHHKMTGALPEDATVEEMLAEEINIDEIT